MTSQPVDTPTETPGESLCNLFALMFNEPDWDDQDELRRRRWEEFAREVTKR